MSDDPVCRRGGGGDPVRGVGVREDHRSQVNYEALTWRHIREATDEGWGDWAGWNDNRLRYLPMVGYAGRDGAGALLGIGGVAWLGPPSSQKAMGFFRFAPRLAGMSHSRWVHRQAVEVLAVAHTRAPLIYARVDDDFPRARAWMERLGFTPSEGDDWVHGVSAPSVDGGRLVRDGERRLDHGGDNTRGSGA